MNPHVRVVAASLLAVGLVLTTAGCSGGSGPEPEVPTEEIEDFDSGEKVPVPYFDPKTGQMYMLMISQDQAECLLDQDTQGVEDMQVALAACDITADAIME
jgi:hypothetical protein